MARARKLTFRARYKRLTFWSKAGFLGVIATFIGLVYGLYSSNETTRRLERIEKKSTFEGTLRPGHLPDPHLCGQLPPKSYRLYLGDVGFVVKGDSPMTALVIGGQQVMTVRRTFSGAAISARAWSADGRLVAEIRENDFSVNPNNSFRISRVSDNDLTVYDQQGAVALRAVILNENAIRIEGIFQPQGSSKVLITEDALLFNGSPQISDTCVYLTASPNITLIDVG